MYLSRSNPQLLRTTLDRSHTRLYSACFLALAATLLPRAGAQAQPQETPPAQQSQPAPAEPPAVEHPASASIPGPSEATGAAPLRVMVGKSLLINTSQRLKRVSITDPAVADVQVVTPTQILVHGRSAGEVSLLIWDELERSRSFDLRVDVDVRRRLKKRRACSPTNRSSSPHPALPSCSPDTSRTRAWRSVPARSQRRTQKTSSTCSPSDPKEHRRACWK